MKRVVGGIWPFAGVTVLYLIILRFGHTEKDVALVIPLIAGSLFYLSFYIAASALRLSVRRAIFVSLAPALLVSVAAGWWLFWGVGRR